MKWMPLSSRPGMGRSFGLVAPPQSTMASNLARAACRFRSQADFGVGDEAHGLGRQQVDTALDHRFVELHVGDSIHQQPADAVGAVEDRHPAPDLVELRGTGDGPMVPNRQWRPSCPYAPAALGGTIPAFLKPLVDDRTSMSLIVPARRSCPLCRSPRMAPDRRGLVNSGSRWSCAGG